jgi:hypothetical protein
MFFISPILTKLSLCRQALVTFPSIERHEKPFYGSDVHGERHWLGDANSFFLLILAENRLEIQNPSLSKRTALLLQMSVGQCCVEK